MDHDVLIVGGRIAGAALALPLASQGLRVLVVDRATMPSLPNVPSCPVIYPAAMRMLDALGIEEAEYGEPSAKAHNLALQFGTHFFAQLPLPVTRGRNYLYGIDRARFDHLFWRRLQRTPNVTLREGFAVTDLLRDSSGRVEGVRAHGDGGNEEELRARAVVGADGRYSVVARKAGAKVVEDGGEQTSTVYYASWEGADGLPKIEGGIFPIFTTGRGTDVLFMPLPEGKVCVITHQRSDRVNIAGDAGAYYLGVLRAHPTVTAWLGGGKQVSELLGMKRIENRYFEIGGPGWVLTGDAYHHKDPADGQGIYDALVLSKLLAESLGAFFRGEQTWEQMLSGYQSRAYAETSTMFRATVTRLKRELYEEPPALIARTVVRWILNDPIYQDVFTRMLAGRESPEAWLDPTLARGAILRGAKSDLRRLFRLGR